MKRKTSPIVLFVFLSAIIILLVLVVNRSKHENSLKGLPSKQNSAIPASPDEKKQADIISNDITSNQVDNLPAKLLNISPTYGLDQLVEYFEMEIIEEAEQQINLTGYILEWQKLRDQGKTMWGSEKWMKEPEYYKNLNIQELAEECFSKPIFGFEMTIYDNPKLGFNRLKIFHNGFSELFEREDMWKGILHGYEFLSSKLNFESDFRTIVRASLNLDSMTKLYEIPEFINQVKGREEIFLSAHLKVLKSFKTYLDNFDFNHQPEGSLGFFGEPCQVAKVALMLAKQINHQKYKEIIPGIKSIRFSQKQNPAELKSFLNLVLEGLNGIVNN